LTPDKQTRSEQREEARAKAKLLREAQKKGDRRKRLALQLGVGGSVIGVVALVAFAIISGSQVKPAVTPANMMFNDGIKIGTNLEAYTPNYTPAPGEGGTDVPNIQVYLDYQCIHCKSFELPNQSQIESWVSKGIATVQIHPVSFVESASDYSAKASNAAVCVAEISPNSFLKFNSVLFANQPEGNAAGPNNEDLFNFAKSVGVTNEAEVQSCINERRYKSWIEAATVKVLTEPLPGSGLKFEGTPFILVDDQQFTAQTRGDFNSPARFAQFLQSVSVN
jgi:protein-disulfide isomerase